MLLAPAALAERAVVLYSAKHRSAADLLPLAAAALEPAGSATLDAGTSRLILVGERAAVDQALALLEASDQRLRTVVLHHVSRRSSELSRSGVDIRWSVHSGNVRVGNLGVRDPGTRVVVEPSAGSRKGSSETTGTLRVLEGGRAVIATGTTVPVRSRGAWHDTTVLVSARTGVEARPTILGDGRVQIEVTPFEGDVSDRGVARVTSSSTSVVVMPGETIAIAGLGRGGATRQRGTGGAGRESESDDLVLLIRVEIEGAADASAADVEVAPGGPILR